MKRYISFILILLLPSLSLSMQEADKKEGTKKEHRRARRAQMRQILGEIGKTADTVEITAETLSQISNQRPLSTLEQFGVEEEEMPIINAQTDEQKTTEKSFYSKAKPYVLVLGAGALGSLATYWFLPPKTVIKNVTRETVKEVRVEVPVERQIKVNGRLATVLLTIGTQFIKLATRASK